MDAQSAHHHAQSAARGDLVAGLGGHVTAKGLAKAGIDGARAGVARIRGDVPAQARYEVSSRGGLGMVVGALGVHVREYGRPRRRRNTTPAGRSKA